MKSWDVVVRNVMLDSRVVKNMPLIRVAWKRGSYIVVEYRWDKALMVVLVILRMFKR